MRLFIMLFLLILLSLSLSCVSRYMPVAQNNIEVSDEFAILRTDDELMAIRVDLWNGEPQYLTEYFSSMFVRIQNRSSYPIRIIPTDFAMINENQMQYDLVPSDIVLEIALSHPSLVPEWFSISAETQRENLNRVNTIRRNIMTRAFAFGEIHPGAIKEGILFFPNLDNKNQEFTILYRHNEILFRKNR
ncbi:MAG: hypothetical protein FWG98_01360 [Candidatus Cloacimonetes bacterium]|nr:hypothetical protein [Candidatus Cloacimonadota bacterium]